MLLNELSSGDFALYRGESFALLPAPYGRSYDPAIHGAPRPITLIEVDDLETQRTLSPGDRRPFSLIFLAHGVRSMPQQTYRITHPTMGELDLFLVPIAAGPDGLQLQAILS
jgi:hypothetical protein